MNINAYIGRFTEDPELRSTTTGKFCTRFTLAVKRPYSKDATDFINFVAWEKTAENICKFFTKGKMIAIRGYLTSRKIEDKNGNKRTAFEVVCEEFDFCESKKPADNIPHFDYVNYENTDLLESDLPFNV